MRHYSLHFAKYPGCKAINHGTMVVSSIIELRSCMPCVARHPLEKQIVSGMHKDIKRRLLHEVVQANLTMYTVIPSSTPVGVERQRWTAIGRMLCLTAALVLMPIDDMSTVISTVIKQHIEALRPPLVRVQRPAGLYPAE